MYHSLSPLLAQPGLSSLRLSEADLGLFKTPTSTVLGLGACATMLWYRWVKRCRLGVNEMVQEGRAPVVKPDRTS